MWLKRNLHTQQFRTLPTYHPVAARDFTAQTHSLPTHRGMPDCFPASRRSRVTMETIAASAVRHPVGRCPAFRPRDARREWPAVPGTLEHDDCRVGVGQALPDDLASGNERCLVVRSRYEIVRQSLTDLADDLWWPPYVVKYLIAATATWGEAWPTSLAAPTLRL